MALKSPRTGLASHQPGSLVKAIAVGYIIDTGGTAVVLIVATTIYSIVLSAQGRTDDQVRELLSKPNLWSPYALITAALGLVMSVIAGYQCGAIANRNAYFAPGLLAALTTATAALLSDHAFALPALLTMSALTVLATLCGAWLHVRKFAAH